MKTTRTRKSARALAGSIAALLAVQAVAPSTHAAPVTWDITPGTVGAGDSAVTGGTGTWNPSDVLNGNWTTDGGVNNVAWSNAGNDTAIFGGTTGTVTLASGATVGGLTFNDNNGYVVTGSTITFGAGGTITANVDAQIDSLLDAASFDLIFAGAGNLTFSNAIANGAALTKNDAGTLTLTGTNGFTSATINGGTIGGGTLTLSGGATALTSSTTSAVNSAITMSAAGTITSSAGVLTLGGTLDAGSAALTFAGAGNTTVSNAIANGTTLTKNDAGTVALNAASNYAGLTTVSGGVLEVSANEALGTAAAGTVVSSGGTLRLAGVNYATAEALDIAGVGFSGGALASTGTSTYAGTITVSINATISSTGTLDLTGGVIKNGTTATFTGGGTISINGVGISGASANSDLVVDGATLVLNVANTYNGPTSVINSGTLQLGASNLLPTAPVTDLTLTSSTFDMQTFSDQIGTLTMSSGTVSGSGTLTLGGDVTSSGTSSIAPNVALGASRIFTISGGTTTASGVVGGTGFSLTKEGAGTLVLSNANTFDGGTNINLGILSVSGSLADSGAVTVGGGTYDVAASDTVGAVTLSSGTISGVGTLTGASYAVTNTTGTTTISASLGSNAATLIKTGAGALTLSGTTANGYTGDTTISLGTLTLAKSASVIAVAGNLIVQSGATLSTTTAASNQIADTASITFQAGSLFAAGIVDTVGAVSVTGPGGSFNLGSNSNLSVSSLTLNGTTSGTTYSIAANSGNSTMTIGAGGLTMTGAIYQVAQTSGTNTAKIVLNGNVTTTGASQLTKGAGTQIAQLDLGASARTFDITDTMSIAPIIIGAGGGINKIGSGALTLSGVNTFSGDLSVAAGTVTLITSASAAGAGTINFNTGGPTAATVQISGALTIANPILVTAGSTGTNTLAQSTNNTAAYTGAFTVNDNLTISSAATSAALTVFAGGATVASAKTITLQTDAAGGITVNGVVAGLGGVTTAGAGTGTIALGTAAQTYTGGFTLGGSGLAVPQVSSTGADGNPTNGPFGAGTTASTLGTGTMRATTSFDTTIKNVLTLAGDVTVPTLAAEKSLIFTGPATLTGNRTFTAHVGTTVAGKSLTFSGAIGGIGFGITKAGTGTMILSGTNTYDGGTTVTDGRLIATSGSALGSGALTVDADKSFVYRPTAAGSLTIGGTLNLGNGTTTNIGTALGGSVSQSVIAVTGAASLLGTGVVNINLIPGFAPAAGTHNLITATSGLSGGTYTLGPIFNNTNFTVSNFNRATDTAISVDVATVTALSGNVLWKGGLAGNTGVWAATNGSTLSNWQVTDGVNQGLAPGATADLVFSTATAPGTMAGMTLGADMTLRTLTVNNTASAFGLVADGFTLTLTPASATTGITVASLAQASTIAVPVVLGANQTWTNYSPNALTVSGIVSGGSSLTKAGIGSVALNGSAVNTFNGGLNVNGGILTLNFANLATPTNLIDSGNTLGLGGGTLSITGKSTGTTNQTLGNVTVNSGGGQILGNKNGGTATNIILGTLTATASGGSLLVGNALATASAPVITTTTDKDATGIYGGRVAFFNGTANTGYDWATTVSVSSPYTLGAYSAYTTMVAGATTDTLNQRAVASLTLTGVHTHNSLKFAPTATGQVLNLGGTLLTLNSGGLLITGASFAAGPLISNGTITASNSSGSYDLIVHQYNAGFGSGNAAGIGVNTQISAVIANNLVGGTNPVTLVKAGTGSLWLTGANTFTGGIIVNGGHLVVSGSATALNNNQITFNASGTLINQIALSSTAGITINNGAMVSFAHNTTSLTLAGAVTGVGGGITLAQAGGGATNLNFNSTANTFTGPIVYAVTPNAGQNGVLTVNSFADSSALGEGNIRFGVAGTGSNQHIFTYGGGAIASVTLNNRRIELAGSHALPVINNNSGQAFTINTDLLPSGTGTKTLTLGGTGAGISTFVGSITNGTITTLNLSKAGTGTWVLSGTNSYNGTTAIAASGGTLQLGSGGTGGSLNISSAISVGTSAIFAVNQSDTVTQGTHFSNAVISGAGGFRQAGSGTTVLNLANTYTGTTTIGAGTLEFTTAQTLTGGLTFGATAGSATTGALDLSAASATFGGAFVVQTNTATVNTITIGSGRTLATNGNVTIGANTAAGTVTNLTVSGATTGVGSWTITNAAAAGTFQIGAATGATNSNEATVDMSGLGTFNANLSDAASVFRIGDVATTSAGSVTSSLKLAATSTITVATLGVGDNSGSNSTKTLSLGTGVNTINANAIRIGEATGQRSSGTIDFQHASNGSLVIRSQTGATGTADLTMVSTNNTGGNNHTARLLMAGHTADVSLDAIVMATRTGASTGGSGTGEITFDRGTFSANSTTMTGLSGAGLGGVTGTITLGSGSGSGTASLGAVTMAVNTNTNAVTSIADAILNINGGTTVTATTINMANAGNVGSTKTANGSINLNGGSLTLAGDITRTGGAGTENATITLNGGTLDMAGNDIGTLANTISLVAQQGTLQNVLSINGTGGLTKTTAGTLILTGTNSYSGLTTVSAGTLQMGITNGILSGNAVTVVPTGASAVLDLAGFNQTIGGAGLTLGGATASSAATVINSTGTSTLTLSGGANAVTYDATSAPLGATVSVATVSLNGAPQTFTVNDSTNVLAINELTVSSAITGASSELIKAGDGSLKLDGNQGYNTLTVNAGTANVNGSLTTGTAAVTVSNAGTKLRFGSVSQTLSSLSIGAGSTVIFTSGTASGAFSGGGKAPSFGGSAVVPEPGTIGLLLVGALGVLNRRRRQA